jgi:Fur family ferric uptake transcriptional regulator
MAAIADLMTSDSRVGPAIGLTWLPTVSHQAVYDALRALTGAGLVRRIQPSGFVGGGTLERYNGANFKI